MTMDWSCSGFIWVKDHTYDDIGFWEAFDGGTDVFGNERGTDVTTIENGKYSKYYPGGKVTVNW